jgi:hypothetical protein
MHSRAAACDLPPPAQSVHSCRLADSEAQANRRRRQPGHDRVTIAAPTIVT